MDKNEILDCIDQINTFLEEGVFVMVFRNIEMLNAELHEWWGTDRLNTIRNVYKPMLQYHINSGDDPEQDKIFNKLRVDLYVLTDDLKETLMARVDYSFEYVIKRSEMSQRKQLPELQRNMLVYDGVIVGSLRAQYERDCERLFTYFWLCDRLNDEQEAILVHLMDDDLYSDELKALLVSALTLNLLRYFDFTKLSLLLKLSSAKTAIIKSRAMVGLLCALQTYNKRLSFYSSFQAELKLALDDVVFHRDLRTTFIQMMRTDETIELTRHIREDLMPEMMKMAPKMAQHFKKKRKDIEDEDEMNPDWNLDDDDLTKTMEEFARLQREGSDVYYSSFSHMRHVPFFSTFSNWFLPFSTHHSSLVEMKKEGQSVLDILGENPFMCNSDKYALTSSFMQMPLIQRNMIIDNLGSEREAMQEMIHSTKQDVKQSPLILNGNQYVQDLFRFYELNSDAKGLNKAFSNINELLHFEYYSYFNTTEDILELANFLFHKKNYLISYNLFAQLSVEIFNAGIYQKMAFCMLQNQRYQDALDWLNKAELLESNHIWTKRQQALCYSKLGLYDNAVSIYAKLLDDDIDNRVLNSKFAALLFKAKRYDEALKVYFKLDYIKPQERNKRQIAWISFVAAKYDQSIRYFEKLIVSDSMEAVDYLNFGHALWASNQLKRALSTYRKSFSLLGDLDHFVNLFLDDLVYLEKVGVERKQAIMMLDAILILD